MAEREGRAAVGVGVSGLVGGAVAFLSLELDPEREASLGWEAEQRPQEVIPGHGN